MQRNYKYNKHNQIINVWA